MNKKSFSAGSARRLLHPKMTVLVTSSDDEGNSNIITLAWAMPVSADPPLAAISVGFGKYSHDLISNYGEFVINIPDSSLLDEVEFCGSRSGDEVDKFDETGLTPEEGKEVRTPRIEECVANIECRLEDSMDAGDHTIFVGRIVASSVDEGAFDFGSEVYDSDEFKPIFHLGGPNFITSGEKLG